MAGHELAGGLDAEVLEEDRSQRRDLHLAEAREGGEVRAELVRVCRVGPHTRGIAVVPVADVDGQLVYPLGHRAWVPVDHRLLEEHRLEIGGGERRGVDCAEALLQRERSLKGLHHRDPLVELEAHQQGHGIRGDEGVRLVGLREVEAVGHAPDRTLSACEVRTSRVEPAASCGCGDIPRSSSPAGCPSPSTGSSWASWCP
jgi:hypothetical protein